MEVCHIVATDRRGCIGKNNELPWHIPTDLKYFKDCTRGFPVLMGRKTFESIGRALPGRLNVILTRDASYKAPEGVVVTTSLKEALEVARAKDLEKAYIIGGGEIYRSSMDLVDKVYLTKVDTEVEGGDAFYPSLPENAELISKNEAHDVFDLSFCVYSIKKQS